VSQLPHYRITYRLLSSKIKSAYGSQDQWGPFVIQWLSDTAHLKLSLGVRITIRYRNLSSRNFTPKRPLSLQTVRELDRARTPESKVLVWSQSLDPIDSIG
jgi:hypothetical protein